MKWTKEKPTQYGFYFAMMEGETYGTLVRVSKAMYDTEYTVTHFGNELNYPLDDYLLWFGPLELLKPPLQESKT